jgi:hypothetical protein
VAGQQPADAGEERFLAREVAGRQQLGEALLVGARLDEARLEDRLDLRREEQPVARLRPVEGLDPEAVPRDEQLAAIPVPDGEREHSSQAAHHIRTIATVKM